MATDSELEDEVPTTNLAKRGDVILVLGKGTGTEVVIKLLVASAFLREASTVFDKMFDGRFAEGKGLSSASPRELPPPDDDPTCMSLFCHIVHMKTTEVPRQLDVNTLAGFAILCDKYDCVNAVRLWSRVSVLELLSQPSTTGYEKLLMTTYALDLPDEFRKATRSLIHHRTFSVDIDVATHGKISFPSVSLISFLRNRW
jgi:hypothetical protein